MISVIIRHLCQNWNLSDDENYALQFCETNNKNYVTEKNRNDVKNGSVLRLCFSPTKTVHDILETIRMSSNVDKTRVLEKLASLSSDMTFALEFIKEKGLGIIISMIENEQVIGDMLKYVMLSFVELMDHGTISWDIIQPKFITRNIHFINHPSTVPSEVIQCALSTLENIIQNSSNYSSLIENDVPFTCLLNLLQDAQSKIIQQNTIALINALFMKGDDSRRRTIAGILSAKPFRAAFLDTFSTANIGLSHQLYVLQTLTLGLLEERMMTPMNPQEQEANDKVKELRRIAFDEGIFGESQPDAHKRSNSIVSTGHYKKLGFKCDLNPTQDFIETPPGILALDCMLYFARNYTQQYTKVINSLRFNTNLYFSFHPI